MNKFDDNLHTMKKSNDGSYTAYSKEYDENYHSTRDGALNESLYKHVIPAFKIKKDLDEINILDICFGLGFNTLATIFYYKKIGSTCRVNIYSPELDLDLVKSLKNFIYPKEFEDCHFIILSLIENGVYSDGALHVELFLGDAREYIKRFENKFDIVYQDAFSPSKNPILWTREYFSDIKKACKKNAILTTYSIAFATRLALYENNFYIYLNSGDEFRDASVASLVKLDEFTEVDMIHKISCNTNMKSLRD